MKLPLRNPALDEAIKNIREAEEEAEREHQKAIPELTKYWIGQGKEILDKKHHKFWCEIVPIRLDDLYRGAELKDCLEIVKELNSGCSLEFAKELIEKQNHSGMSYSLVRSMVKGFCDRGRDFFDYTVYNS